MEERGWKRERKRRGRMEGGWEGERSAERKGAGEKQKEGKGRERGGIGEAQFIPFISKGRRKKGGEVKNFNIWVGEEKCSPPG